MTQPCTDSAPMTPLRYMERLWGGSPQGLDKSGPEKRFEIDFQTLVDVEKSSICSPDHWEQMLALLNITQMSHKATDFGLSIVTQDVSVVINAEKLVVTTGSTIALHNAFKPIATLCQDAGCGIQWASFMHKETTGPTSNHLNTLEFAILHEVFPTGHPFYLGPITADHFFCFIFDAIDRSNPEKVHEDDVQINAVFYAKGLPTDVDGLQHLALSVLGGKPEDINIVFGKGSEVSATRFLDHEFFATLRIAPDPLETVISFETNINNEEDYVKSLTCLCKTLTPSRFSVVLLLDPQSKPKVAPQSLLSFDKYAEGNAFTTELHGYVVKNINFVPC